MEKLWMRWFLLLCKCIQEDNPPFPQLSLLSRNTGAWMIQCDNDFIWTESGRTKTDIGTESGLYIELVQTLLESLLGFAWFFKESNIIKLGECIVSPSNWLIFHKVESLMLLFQSHGKYGMDGIAPNTSNRFEKRIKVILQSTHQKEIKKSVQQNQKEDRYWWAVQR